MLSLAAMFKVFLFSTKLICFFLWVCYTSLMVYIFVDSSRRCLCWLTEPSFHHCPCSAESHVMSAVSTSSANRLDVLFPCSRSIRSRDTLFAGMHRCSGTSLASITRHCHGCRCCFVSKGQQIAPKQMIYPDGQHHKAGKTFSTLKDLHTVRLTFVVW